MTKTPMDRPGIFDYATSELSQDAMICWLLRWADLEGAVANIRKRRAILEESTPPSDVSL